MSVKNCKCLFTVNESHPSRVLFHDSCVGSMLSIKWTRRRSCYEKKHVFRVSWAGTLFWGEGKLPEWKFHRRQLHALTASPESRNEPWAVETSIFRRPRVQKSTFPVGLDWHWFEIGKKRRLIHRQAEASGTNSTILLFASDPNRNIKQRCAAGDVH